MKRRLLFLSFALLLAGAVITNAGRSSDPRVANVILFGTIYDTNHSVIPYAQIVARSLEGKEYWVTANDEGAYKFELPLARYRVEANSPGFCPRRLGVIGEHYSVTQRPLDFILEAEHSERPCRQKSMIRKEQPRRKPELFRSIAE